MKKVVAMLLVFCMLFGYAAAAEESILDSAFAQGIIALLNSFDIARDMLTLNVDYQGGSVFSAKLKGRENMFDLSAAVDGNSLQAQVSDTDISVSADGMTFSLLYEDVEALINSFTSEAAPALEAYKQIFSLLLDKVIMPDVVMDYSDGTHITYSADEKTLLGRLAEFADAVLANEQYIAPVEQAIQLISSITGGEAMTLRQFREQIDAELKRLETAETDFAVAFEFITDNAFTKVDVTGEIGNSFDKYAMTWMYRNEEDAYKLDGLLWETRVMGEKTRKYEITIKTDFRGNEEENIWSLSIDHPSAGFNLEASGNMQENLGSFCFYLNHLYRPESGFMVQLDYALEDDGLMATAFVAPGRMGYYIGTLMVSEKRLNLTVKSYSGRKLFVLNLYADEQNSLKYGYMEYNPSVMNAYNYNRKAIMDSSSVTAEYDGEKLIIKSNGVTVTCTGAFESDQAYVITLKAEGESVKPEEDTAYIRFEYEGEEGNYAITGRMIEPQGTDMVKITLVCEPSEGITEYLRDKEDVIRLTPETIQMMLTQ
ncbi:MAG: hypothetical protein IKH30_06815 [Clostridia bacterium]|nr:hypothetical protein [Clostridia bacterium]